ncbi:heme-binding protein [Novosphingobium panipatense]
MSPRRRSGWRHRGTGRPVARHRGPVSSSQIAQDKAYTAASFKVPSPDVYKMVAGNPALSGGIAAKPGIAMFGGGLPIAIAGEIVGAIGVSGGTEEQDTQCANAALISIGATQY